MATKVGVLGVGMMGKGMVKNLLKAGYEVYAYDPFPAASEKAKELGANVMSEIKEVGEKVDVLLASLPTTEAVSNAVNAALPYMKEGTVICNMSTSAPSVEKILYEAAKSKGIGYLDSPVSGGPMGAENATMSIMVGGDAEVFEKAKPVYEKIGGKVVYLGASGCGQVMKLCNNSVFAGNYIVLVEALLTATKAGMDPQTVYDVFKASTAQSRVLEILGENLINATFDKMIFATAHMHKDIDLYIELADELQMPVLFGSVTNQLFNAAMKKGYGTQDMSAVAKIIEDLAGETVAKK